MASGSHLTPETFPSPSPEAAEAVPSSSRDARPEMTEPLNEGSSRLSDLTQYIEDLPGMMYEDNRKREELHMKPINYALERLKLERSLHELYISFDKLLQVPSDGVEDALQLLEWLQKELEFYCNNGFEESDEICLVASPGIRPPLLRLQCSIKAFKQEILVLGNVRSYNMVAMRRLLHAFHTHVDYMAIKPDEADIEMKKRHLRQVEEYNRRLGGRS